VCTTCWANFCWFQTGKGWRLGNQEGKRSGYAGRGLHQSSLSDSAAVRERRSGIFFRKPDSPTEQQIRDGETKSGEKETLRGQTESSGLEKQLPTGVPNPESEKKFGTGKIQSAISEGPNRCNAAKLIAIEEEETRSWWPLKIPEEKSPNQEEP